MGKEKQGKLLYILKFLWKETDEEHPVSARKLVEYLEECGISCERKSIYRDLDTIEEFGFDIIRTPKGVYMASRLFELPELMLLAGAVQASQFMTEKKTANMLEKLGKLAGRAGERQLKRQLYAGSRVKTRNESVYYNVDGISDAMECNCQISFYYCAWTTKGQLVRKHNGERYIISPWFLQWDDERCYLVGYDESMGRMKHFRIDKMLQIQKLSAKRMGRDVYESLDVQEYGRLHFGMYHGERKRVTLVGDNELTGVLIDRFGTDIWIHPEDSRHFRVSLEVAVSDKFFGWIASYGGRIQIAGPEYMKRDFDDFLKHLLMKNAQKKYFLL